MSFENLKRRNNSMNINDLVAAAEKAGGGNQQKSYGDERLWKPTVDKSGNGYAVIRFLPSRDGNSLPWVQYWDHGFKGPTGRWYIERSLTSIGQPDPVSEANSALWATGRDSDKATVRERKRRLHYVSNIYVVSDPANPENEGKVFMYQYGKKIFEKIMDVMQPSFQDEEPINPFDFWAGANFKLKIRNVEGYRNYDKSEFSETSALLDGDEDRLKSEVYDRMHDLSEYTDPKNYKSYDELKARFNMVIGATDTPTSTADQISLDETKPSKLEDDIPPMRPVAVSDDNDDEDDTLSYFAKLAAQD